MRDEDPVFLYRGTTLSRVEDHWNGNSEFPGNWTDDPLQGASYALGYALGDSHNNVPVVLATEYEESFFLKEDRTGFQIISQGSMSMIDLRTGTGMKTKIDSTLSMKEIRPLKCSTWMILKISSANIFQRPQSIRELV